MDVAERELDCMVERHSWKGEETGRAGGALEGICEALQRPQARGEP